MSQFITVKTQKVITETNVVNFDFLFNVLDSYKTRKEALTDRDLFVRRRPSERFHEICLEKFVKHPHTVMKWS